MLLHTEKIQSGEDEVIIKYKEMNNQIKDIIMYVNEQVSPIIGSMNKEQHILTQNEIYYFESVDNMVFAYTKSESYETKHTLYELEDILNKRRFFRCSKSIIINITRIKALKSLAGNRIDATLDNQEHVIISRRYAKEFRRRLDEKS